MYREILLHRRSKIGFCDPTTLSHPERRMFRRGQSQRSEESSSAPVVFISLFFIRVTPGLGLHSQPIIRSRDNNYLKKKKKKNVDLAHSRSTTPPPPPLPSLLSHLPGILLQKQIKRRRETAIVFASAVENKRNSHG